jgi:hypothetical protein
MLYWVDSTDQSILYIFLDFLKGNKESCGFTVKAKCSAEVIPHEN